MIELPADIAASHFLTNRDKEMLSNVDASPAALPSFDDDNVNYIFQYFSLTPNEMRIELHKYASKLLSEGKVNEAWQVLLTDE